MSEDDKNPEIKKVEEPKKEKAVSKKEFSALETKVNEGFDAIMNLLQNMQAPTPAQPVAPVKEAAGTDAETPVPPAWRQLVEDILGEDFDCEFSLPESGGSIFRIIVPKAKSNAPQMHWQYHKRDVRSKELGNTGVKGVKEWCLLVRKNLTAAGFKLPVYP